MSSPGLQQYDTVYGVQLLDDVHNYFPALLYDHRRFETTPQVFQYIRSQMNARFNLFANGAAMYSASQQQQQQPYNARQQQQQPQQQQQQPQPDQALSSLAATSLLLSFLDVASSPEVYPLRARPLTTAELFASIYPPAVVVRPSQEVLALQTRIVEGSTLPPGSVCTVCQDIMGDDDPCRLLIPCGHIYHQNCIDQWFARNVHCPSCRHDIREPPTPALGAASAPPHAPEFNLNSASASAPASLGNGPAPASLGNGPASLAPAYDSDAYDDE